MCTRSQKSCFLLCQFCKIHEKFLWWSNFCEIHALVICFHAIPCINYCCILYSDKHYIFVHAEICEHVCLCWSMWIYNLINCKLRNLHENCTTGKFLILLLCYTLIIHLHHRRNTLDRQMCYSVVFTMI